MRRIEGFEKRRSAKPKRSLAHPPGFVRAFQDPPTPLGECRVVLPLPGLRGTHCHAQVSFCVFAGVSLRRPRQCYCIWPVFSGKRLLVWANQPSSRGLCDCVDKTMVIAAGCENLVGHQQSKLQACMSCQAAWANPVCCGASDRAKTQQ